jgi:hypothetical protein
VEDLFVTPERLQLVIRYALALDSANLSSATLRRRLVGVRLS